MNEKRFAVLLAGITAVGLFLRVWGLSSQPISPDDYDVGLSAINYIENGQFGPTMWNHPGLRNILIYYSMKVLAAVLWGLRAGAFVWVHFQSH